MNAWSLLSRTTCANGEIDRASQETRNNKKYCRKALLNLSIRLAQTSRFCWIFPADQVLTRNFPRGVWQKKYLSLP